MSIANHLAGLEVSVCTKFQVDDCESCESYGAETDFNVFHSVTVIFEMAAP